jgi:hypothetical protein
MIDYNQYIKDTSQTNLYFNQLTEQEKLRAYRYMLYEEMLGKLRDLQIKREQLVKDYNIKVKDIDKLISDGSKENDWKTNKKANRSKSRK